MWKRVLLALLAFGLIAIPLLFLFAPSEASLQEPFMSKLYSSLVVLLDEKPARFLFCAVWLVVDGVIAWKFVFSRRLYESGSVDGLGD